jgi:hypothetical protein
METETGTEQSADRLTISLLQKKQSQSSSVEWRTKQLLAMAEVFREPLTAELLAMYVESLADLSDEQIRLCVGRAIRELKWFPKPAELRELVGCNPKGEQDAEARAAWDVVVDFTGKYIQSDPQGCYVIDQGVRRVPPPVLSQRILDTVRRTGGWRAYKLMDAADLPHQQKRFVAEYQAWTAVEQVPASKLLTELPRLQLVAKPMDPPCVTEPKQEQPKAPAFKPKPIPEPLTDAQLRDRREMLRQQAASLAKSSKA